MRMWPPSLLWTGLLACLLSAGCGGPTPTATALDGWLARSTHPTVRIEGARVVLAGTPQPLDTPEMATLAQQIALPVELHRVLLLRVRPVLDAAEAEALERRRRTLAAEADPLAKQAAALLEQAVRAGSIDRARVVDALRAMRPLIEEKASRLAALRLEALHRITRDFWRRLPPEERVMLRFEVVDTAGARAGHWAVQYLERVLQVEGEGPRILYVEQPLASVAERVLDEATGLDVFEDPARLRRDLLAEGARAWLDQTGPDFAGE